MKFVDSINALVTDTGHGQTDGRSIHTMCLYFLRKLNTYSKRTPMPARYA